MTLTERILKKFPTYTPDDHVQMFETYLEDNWDKLFWHLKMYWMGANRLWIQNGNHYYLYPGKWDLNIRLIQALKRNRTFWAHCFFAKEEDRYHFTVPPRW